jgi:hypothetical protein
MPDSGGHSTACLNQLNVFWLKAFNQGYKLWFRVRRPYHCPSQLNVFWLKAFNRLKAFNQG